MTREMGATAMATKPAEIFPPGEFLREELEERGWTQGDLAEILGRPLRLVNELIAGKRGITPETATGLAAALGTTPELWMNLDSAYQLWRLKARGSELVARKSRLFTRAPIKEMIRRCWIESSDNIDVLEQRVLGFLGVQSLDDPPAFPATPRMAASVQEITPSQEAWLCRARQLSAMLSVEDYEPALLTQTIRDLRHLATDIQEIRRVPEILGKGGIRFVVIEHLHGSKIDGASFWLRPSSPVVALSLRYGRIDSFWFTLLHELGHVKNRDGLSIDDDLLETSAAARRPDWERSADSFAAEQLVPRDQFESFIEDVGPSYSKRHVLRFAQNIGVHPGIVVGQLQHRKEIPWSNLRELLVQVREEVTETALTDGWGVTQPVAQPRIVRA